MPPDVPVLEAELVTAQQKRDDAEQCYQEAIGMLAESLHLAHPLNPNSHIDRETGAVGPESELTNCRDWQRGSKARPLSRPLLLFPAALAIARPGNAG